MALFFLDYDLRKKRDYKTLYDELAEFGAVRVLQSTWAFRRINTNCSGLRDHFRRYIDSDDGLCVTEVTDWATCKTLNSPPQV